MSHALRALHRSRQDGKRLRYPAAGQPDLQVHSRQNALRELLEGLPPRRRQSQRGAGHRACQADYLTNYEIGWKTQWFDHRLPWNGAIFWEDWKDFQFCFIGAGNLTIIANGGNARTELLLTRFTQCHPVDNNQSYFIPAQPRTIYIKFGQKFF